MEFTGKEYPIHQFLDAAGGGQFAGPTTPPSNLNVRFNLAGDRADIFPARRVSIVD